MSSIALREPTDTTLLPPLQLSADERQLFADAEQAIEKGLHEVWIKLKLIHDRALYREEYDSFETYCAVRWQRGRDWGYKQVEAGRVYEVLMEEMSTTGIHMPFPTSERQTRPLSGLDNAQIVEAWARATEKANGNVPSSTVVESIVRAINSCQKEDANSQLTPESSTSDCPDESSTVKFSSPLPIAPITPEPPAIAEQVPAPVPVDEGVLYRHIAAVCFDLALPLGKNRAAQVKEIVEAALMSLLPPPPSLPRVIYLPAAPCAGFIAPPPPVAAVEVVEEAGKVDDAVWQARRGCWIVGDETILRQRTPSSSVTRAIKQIQGYDWKPDKQWWTVPLYETAGAVLTLVDACNFAISAADRQRLRDIDDTYKREGKSKRKRFFALSSAKTGTFQVPSFERVHTLYSYQRAGVEALVEAKTAFLGDDRGNGKTVQALAAIEAEHAYPALIICPVNAKSVWHEHIQSWLPGRYKVQVLRGTQCEIDLHTDVIIVNYDIVCNYMDALAQIDWQVIVLDESHRIKAWTTKRTQAILALAREIKPRLRYCLSGTALMNGAAEFGPQLEFLGRLKPLFGGVRQFNANYTNMGKGGKNLEQLNLKLRQNCYIRREKAEVLDQLPPKQRVVNMVDIDLEAYLKKEKELIDALRAQQAEDETAQAAGTKHEQKFNALPSIMTLRRMLGLAKIEPAIEWIQDFLDETTARNGKLVVFAWHSEVVEAIAEHFNAPKIRGGVSESARDAAVQAFQNDPACRLIICNIIAASEAITLHAASDTLFLELGWNASVHDQAEDRVHRIGQTAESVTATYLLSNDTIDKWIMEIIEDKRQITTVGTTGKEVEGHDESNLVKYLTGRLLAKDAGTT